MNLANTRQSIKEPAGQRWALVTGASAGIGAEFSRQLALEKGYNLLVTARRAERLANLAEEITQSARLRGLTPLPQVLQVVADISTESGQQALISQVSSLGITPDLLINNAGIGSMGDFSRLSFAREAEMVRTNCLGPLVLSHHFLPQMRKRGTGAVINVGSVCSFVPMPYMATYGATKAFLFSLSLALGREAARDGVHVMAVCPGPTDS